MSCLNIRLLRVDTKLNASVFYLDAGFSAKARLTCVSFVDKTLLYASDGKLFSKNTPLFVTNQ